jgi:hypothetical protein
VSSSGRSACHQEKEEQQQVLSIVVTFGSSWRDNAVVWYMQVALRRTAMIPGAAAEATAASGAGCCCCGGGMGGTQLTQLCIVTGSDGWAGQPTFRARSCRGLAAAGPRGVHTAAAKVGSPSSTARLAAGVCCCCCCTAARPDVLQTQVTAWRCTWGWTPAAVSTLWVGPGNLGGAFACTSCLRETAGRCAVNACCSCMLKPRLPDKVNPQMLLYASQQARSS